MKKLKGFTLTELMIALAVIGVLSALVLPMLSNNSPNRSKMMMKKAYYTIEEAVSDLINDTSLYPMIDADGNEYVGFDNTNNTCTDTCSGVNKFPKLFAQRLNIDGNISYSGTDNNTASFTTNDGMAWTVTSADMATPPSEITDVESGANQLVQTIVVDVNGNKKPNCQQGESSCSDKTNGFDKFTVYVSQTGKVVPANGQPWFVEAIGIGSDLNGD